MKATRTATATLGLARQRVYSWGADLSGSMTGAGGVGGLAFVGEYALAGSGTSASPYTSTLSRPLAPAYDHNGNVSGYFDCRAATGTTSVTAGTASGRKMVYTFEYDAFGRELMADLTQSGTTTTFPASVAPPIRFSTKYSDIETGLVYYGYRYYSPDLGRWVNRDPIGEEGGLNMYGMVRNDCPNLIDVLGREPLNQSGTPQPAPDPSWPQSDYNCAGCAFGQKHHMSLADTLKELSSCSGSSENGRCAKGQKKCALYIVVRMRSVGLNTLLGQAQKEIVINPVDFHVACGNEGGGDSYHKNGKNPVQHGKIYMSYVNASNQLGWEADISKGDAYVTYYCCGCPSK